MYLVIGNTPRRVELKDLGDTVYYKQQKIFTDAEYDRSSDLQREIQKGSLTILRQTKDKNSSFEVPVVAFADADSKVETGTDSSKLNALLERINALEDSIKERNSAPQDMRSDLLSVIVEKIERLEKGVQGVSNEESLTVLYNAIKKLEQRLDGGANNDALLSKVEDLLSRAPAARGSVHDETIATRPEDVYVPTVTVEDANTHIKLNVRSVESGNDVVDSLKKLKELRSKSK